MSGLQVDVLAVMDGNVRAAQNRCDTARTMRGADARRAELREQQTARATVAELIEAGRELVEAQADYDRLDAPGGAKWDRLSFARERHAAALARAQGGAA